MYSGSDQKSSQQPENGSASSSMLSRSSSSSAAVHAALEDQSSNCIDVPITVTDDADPASLAKMDEQNKKIVDEEELLQWGAIERLPTCRRVRTSLLDKRDLVLEGGSAKEGKEATDVGKLGAEERRLFIDKLLKKIEEDNRRLLLAQQHRINRVGLELPTVEVRYQNLRVEAECQVVRGKPLPSLWNSFKGIFHAITPDICGARQRRQTKIRILKDISGIVKPSRMTLLLGPPGCGKTTLLLALAGKLTDQNLQATGEISYNGHKLNEFVPERTSAYISQYDLHMSEMTVRETLDFSARCQGSGSRPEIIAEVSRREKQAGIIPVPDIDTYMKAIAVEGSKRSMQTDYVLKILGLDSCADTMVGDGMRRGISGGQKKRLTTGEMMIGPSRVLLMDEITNGLDSSTTLQIATCLQQWTHITGSTTLASLLQPAPETFNLFDDIILMSQGIIVYHGPRSDVLDFFQACGFKCPPRKGVADFLQEVVSPVDQSQYWCHRDRPYSYVSVDEFSNNFKASPLGKKLEEELSHPFERSSQFHKNALSFNKYSISKWELLKACIAREWLLMKRNSFVHIFKSVQMVITALISITVFIHTEMTTDINHANFYLGAIFYALVRLLCNGIPELSLTVSRLGVFYKQRDFSFYPAWAYSIPAAILKVPFSFVDAFLWTAITYYGTGYSPEFTRFFRHFLLLFLLHQVAISTFRLVASVFRNPSVAASAGLFCLIVMFLFGGFILPKSSLPSWLAWGFWLSPLTYAEIGASVNEFLAPRWQKASYSNATLGEQVLRNHGLSFDDEFYWISVAALFGFWLVLNIAFTGALCYLTPPGRSKRMVSHKALSPKEERISLGSIAQQTKLPISLEAPVEARKTNTVLPFEPMAVTFENIQYFVDTPKGMRNKGFKEKRLQLLQDVTGIFRPGILTALMGVTGAGKTTLMDVISGRKTGGMIKGDIRVGGYPKVQHTYSRISSYCEQIDIHTPQITIKEAVTFSAWLRLPSQISPRTKLDFVAEVLEMIELGNVKDALVGVPGMNGISAEQRKRLTIAVELVSNPSIIFMDEPTTGLDARAAAIVMRVVKNIAQTRRTVVCTIHQPSIDIFEAFDELILMKRGGRVIYSGQIGRNSSKIIEYFERIPGVPKIEENYNPATWMLEVTSASLEAELGLDFASLYQESHLYKETEALVRKESSPAPGSKELCFTTRFPQSGWEQFKACLWKKNLSYWRSPKYNLVRLTFISAASLLFGAILWQKGTKIHDAQDLLNMLGSMFILLQFTGIGNCSSVMPFVSSDRAVLYKERFAGMYSPWAYSFAQVLIEIPYVLVQALVFVSITYPAIGFYSSASKVLWYFHATFSTLLYFTYLGMLLVSVTSSFQLASVQAGYYYTIFTLFSGFVIPGPKIPKWWTWFYWICPQAWSMRALLSSQYGDVDEEIRVFGDRKGIGAFLESYFGYHHDQLQLVAFILICFPLLFAFVFAWATANLNFQRR